VDSGRGIWPDKGGVWTVP